MKVLMYDNRKIDPILIDASSDEARDAALLALFKYLDEEWDVYDDLGKDNGCFGRAADIQRQHYQMALAGDAKAAFDLLKKRKGNEYEYWQFIDVVNPLEPDQVPL